MESSGRADCVQLSAAAYAASGLPAGTLPAREVLIKGKGLMAVHLIDTTTPEAAYVRGLLDVGGMRTPRTSSTMPRLDVPLDRPRERTSVRQAASNDAGGTSEQLTAPSLDDASGTDPNNPETQQSSSGKSSRALAAAAAESAKAASRLREAHAMHFVVQTAIAMSPSIFYIVFGFSRRTRFVLPSNALLAACISGVMLFAIRSALPPAVRDALLPRWPLIFVALHTMLVSCITLVLIGDYIAAERDRLPPVVAVRRYFWAIQLALTSLNWLIAQLPVRVAFFPEIVRSFTYVFAALSVARDEAALTPSFAFAVLVEGAACIVFVCFAVELCFRPSQTVLRQLDSLDTCPAALSGVRDFMQHATRTARARLFDDAVLLDATAVVFLGFYSGLMAFHIFIVKPGMPLPAAASSLAQVMTLLLIAAAAAKLRPTSEASLDALAAQHHLATHGHTFTLLRERLAAADSEASILRAACDAIADLFPGAAACALGAFAEGTAQDVVCSLECVGDERSRRALADSLPAGVGTADAGSSVALACRGGPGRVPAVVDSRNQAGGVEVYTDWRAAIAGGLPSTQAITAPLNAGQVVIGFVQLHFNVYAAANRQDTNAERAVLRELSGVVGGAVFVRRALAINRDAFASGMRAAGVPLAPRARQSTTTVTAAAAAAKSRRAFPASEEDARVLALLDERRDADRELLRDWALDAWQLPDGEVARLIAAMLHSGGLLRRFRISPAALSAFIDDVLQKYPNNPFHCGRHAFSVMHTSFLFLQDGVLRKELLEPIDSLALLLAALCHDLEHPGTTNAFQINSGSELAMRYNDSSVLEHHHCAMAFATMERHALLSGLDRSEYVVLRKSIVAAILATDMAQHKDLLARVSARVMRRESEAEHSGGGIGFSRSSPEDRRLLVAFLLHCADLHNPLLPPAMSRRIACELSREFSSQAELERAADLPVTVMLADDDVAKAKMEAGFLDFVVRPLYAALADVAPALGAKCLALIDANRAMWAEIAAGTSVM